MKEGLGPLAGAIGSPCRRDPMSPLATSCAEGLAMQKASMLNVESGHPLVECFYIA